MCMPAQARQLSVSICPFREKAQTCADGLHACNGLHSACCPQQVPNHALCTVNPQVLPRQGVCDGVVLCHVTCRHKQAGWWESCILHVSGWMVCWVRVKRDWGCLAAGVSAGPERQRSCRCQLHAAGQLQQAGHSSNAHSDAGGEQIVPSCSRPHAPRTSGRQAGRHNNRFLGLGITRGGPLLPQTCWG